MPSAWMFIRLRQMIVVGICEECAAKNDATLLREGFAEIRKAFPVAYKRFETVRRGLKRFPQTLERRGGLDGLGWR
jgi:hypothetical protein